MMADEVHYIDIFVEALSKSGALSVRFGLPPHRPLFAKLNSLLRRELPAS
jgi:hypothetical protein